VSSPKFSFEIDPSVLEDGAWMDVPELHPDARLKVRSIDSDRFEKHYRHLSRHLDQKERRGGDVPQEQRTAIMRRCLHEVLLVDWELYDENGKPVPYDPALAKTMCMEKRHLHFQNAVAYCAKEVANLDHDFEAASGKDSAQPSSGSSKTASTSQHSGRS
jgi:hypothetical protein